ncbi:MULTISPECIES: hypothetical protein [Streptomyces]|uniref:Uncharacterized protein n=1 Tax=Streptomyces dengpaensis TaxID=2049881 RepID=A0ABM6STV6_9ACTN|nr:MULTISPECIES: hypothetical protein [Streptomyces]AVH57893.1 hypothetical protein C4B68_21375 [Streptomyces dengpaensis]PIB03924.1 hypothetical protein B1C81_35345 [Streptomyces sp. HG99]
MSQYPVIQPGTTVTSGLLMSMLPVEVSKSSATSRASTITLADDPDLQFQLAANATYFIEFFIRYAAVSPGKFRMDFGTLPAGASGNYAIDALDQVVTGGTGDTRMGVHNPTTPIVLGDRASGSNQCLAQASVYITTSSTPGTLALRWAQETSSATATVVSAGSYARLKRTA